MLRYRQTPRDVLDFTPLEAPTGRIDYRSARLLYNTRVACADTRRLDPTCDQLGLSPTAILPVSSLACQTNRQYCK